MLIFSWMSVVRDLMAQTPQWIVAYWDQILVCILSKMKLIFNGQQTRGSKNGLFWLSSPVTRAARHAVYWTSVRGGGCDPASSVFTHSCLTGERQACWRRGTGSLDYSDSTKWGRMGLILFELQHLSQLYGPISSLKRKKGNWEKEEELWGGDGGRHS